MKQVIVVNSTLKLSAGKLAAQVAHAALGGFLEASNSDREGWLRCGMPKIVLTAESADDLMRLQTLARDKGLATSLVRDAGRTEVPEGTITCLGIGPATTAAIDSLTGALPLLA